MKVLLLIHRLSHGGAQRQLLELARGLDARGHAVSVATFYSGGALEPEVRAARIPLHSLEKRGRWEIVRFAVRALRLTSSVSPDVVYSFLIAPNLLSLLLRLFRPGVRVVWGVRASNMDLSCYDRLARFAFRTGCLLSGLPHRVIANSFAGREYHVEHGYPEANVVVVPNGIDTDRYYPDREKGREIRRALGLSDDATVVGLVGRLDPMKDHATFLEAAKQFAAARPEARFVCVGDGPEAYRDSLVERARRLGLARRVIWAGAREDLPAVYNAFDLLTSSSAFGEGFPNVVGEALACGVPCVVTDVGDAASVVGETSRVVPPRDPTRLAAAWSTALDGGHAAGGARLRERIEREYSIQAMIDRTESELRSTLGGQALAAEG